MQKSVVMHIKVFSPEILNKVYWLMKSLSADDLTIVKAATRAVAY